MTVYAAPGPRAWRRGPGADGATSRVSVRIRSPYASLGLRRRCMPRLVLKVGTIFSGTATLVPLRGFRPVRASRFLTANTPKPRSSTRSPCASAVVIVSRRDRVQNGVDDGLHVPLVQVRVRLGDPLNQFRLDHAGFRSRDRASSSSRVLPNPI